jgi:transcriptional regulator GlxA family with amidase domain
MKVGILVFPGAEVLDFAGPFEVFSVATRVWRRDRDPSGTPFEVFLVAATRNVVTARHGFEVVPHYIFANHPAMDILLVPGGVIDEPRNNPETIEWIRTNAPGVQVIASVCTGAFLLAQAGLLDGLRATTHWEDIADLRREFPNVTIVEDGIWIDEGRVVTSAGISAGIDMCLHLVSRLQDEELAHTTARQMAYDWRHRG